MKLLSYKSVNNAHSGLTIVFTSIGGGEEAPLDRREKRANLVQVRVPGDVVAPLLGSDASFRVGTGMAEPGGLDTRRRCPVRGTRGAGQQPRATRCRRAPTQRQRHSSRERVHATCGHFMWGAGGRTKVKYRKVTFHVGLKGHVTGEGGGGEVGGVPGIVLSPVNNLRQPGGQRLAGFTCAEHVHKTGTLVKADIYFSSFCKKIKKKKKTQ